MSCLKLCNVDKMCTFCSPMTIMHGNHFVQPCTIILHSTHIILDRKHVVSITYINVMSFQAFTKVDRGRGKLIAAK